MQEIQESYIELTTKQKMASKISAIVLIALCAVTLLLFGVVNSLPNILSVLAVSILLTFALIFLACGIIQKNQVSIWISIVFFVPVIIEFLTIYTSLTYADIYPLYIAAPFIASIVTGLIWRNIKLHILPLIFFGVLSVIFSFQSSGVAHLIDNLNGWAFTLPLAAAFVIGFVVFVFVRIARPLKNGNSIEEN